MTAKEEKKRETKKMLLSWSLKTSDGYIKYSQLKNLAKEQTRWSR